MNLGNSKVSERRFHCTFVDDGVVAGGSRAVSMFCNRLRTEIAAIGLELAFDKCEVIPSAKELHTIPAEAFAGFDWVPFGDFKLLGAPLGGEEFSVSHC